MENPRPEKVAVVDEVRERLDASNAAILTEYRGLTVKEIASLRRSLSEAGASYGIYKNTLVRFAARDLGLTELDELLTGPTAIAFIDGDAAAVAKALRDFARTNPNLVIKGGLLGSSILSAKDTAALAELPSREVLLARIAGAFAAPMQQFAGLLQALPRNMAYGLKALIDQGGANPGAAAPADAAPEPQTEPEAQTEPEPQPEAVADAEVEAPVADEAPAEPAADETAPAEAAAEASTDDTTTEPTTE